MNINYILSYIFIQLKNILSKVIMNKSNYPTPNVDGYTLVKEIRPQQGALSPSIGIYKDKKNKKVIIKSVKYIFKNSTYYQLKNEYRILKLFSSVNKKSLVSCPDVYAILDINHQLTLISEYIETISLSTLKNEQLETMVKNIIQNVALLPKESTDISTMPKLIICFNFPIYTLIQIIKDFGNIKLYISLFVKFYKYYSFKRDEEYTFCHRDLHFENILFDGKKLYMIDPEVGVYGNKETDLAIFLRNSFKNKLSFEDSLLNYFIKYGYSYDRFISLSIYYTIQIMAIRVTDDDDYINAKNYLLYFNRKYFSITGYSAIELLYNTYYRFLSKINYINYKLLHYLNKYMVILCYHSISTDGWRFATTPKVFEEQMKFISQRSTISLSSVFNNHIKKGIVVTFDDGYEDFLTTALPILKKYKIPATMFVLGDSKNANHSELQNTKKMLSISQIKSLHKQGIEIGFHTATHSDMRKMSDSELEYEIKTSKENLEKKLGFKLRYFAYPRGIYDKRIIAKVKEAGFEKAFTVNGGTVRKNSDDLLVNRISIEGSVTLNQFVAMISPLGILFETFYIGVLKLKETIVFRLRNNQLKLKGAV